MVDPSSTPSILEITSKIMIAAVITFFVVIIFIFLLHLYARCIWSAAPEDPDIVSWRRQLARQNQPSGAAQRRQRGLDRPTLRSLPVVVYNPKEFKEGLECAVCLSELVEGEKARVLPICKHGFHLDCIDMWFKSHSTCPICRTVVVSEGSDEGVSGSDSVPVQPQRGEGDVNSSGYSSESPVFPTNVLFWGDQVQVRTSVEGVVPSASSSGKPQESLVIDIPMSSVGPSTTTTRMGADDEAQSPVMARIKSLKRLLSRGKKVSPSPCSSTSGFGDDEQV